MPGACESDDRLTAQARQHHSDRRSHPSHHRVVRLSFYASTMTTVVHHASADELRARRTEILHELGLTEAEFEAKVADGGLVGREWSAWSELERQQSNR
jgi:hypothetical protein